MSFLPARAVVACTAIHLFAVAVVGVASAEDDVEVQVEVEVDKPLTLDVAIATAIARNPELESSVYVLRAADARIKQAGQRPNPELGLELENLGGSGDLHGMEALETTLSLSHVIELGDKRQRRVDVAQAEREVFAIEGQALQLDVLSDVTRRFIAVVEAQEKLALAQQVEASVEETIRAIIARVEAARSPEAERSRATIARIRARLDRQRAEQRLHNARRQLVALWGDTEARFSTAVADLFAFPEIAPFDSLVANLQRSPDFLRFATQSRLRTAELHLTQAQARPSLQVGAGVRRLEALDDVGLVAGFSIPLPVYDRRQGAIAEAQARVALNDAQGEAAMVRARTTLYALHQEASTARAEASALRGEVIPLAEQALAQTDSGFQRGRFSYLELANAQRELMDARRAAIEAAADTHRLLAEIERLAAQPLVAATP